MYVYSENSRIFHNELCGCVKRIDPQNRRFTGAANPASELGLMHCKFCAPIVRQMKKEKEELLPYAAQNGLAYFYQRGDNTMVIMTPHGSWKIIAGGKEHALILFHESVRPSNWEKDQYPGYHQQHVRRASLLEYFEYIVDHDAYRRNHPVYQKVQKVPPIKGTKRYRKEQKKTARAKRNSEIKRVEELLKELSVSASS